MTSDGNGQSLDCDRHRRAEYQHGETPCAIGPSKRPYAVGIVPRVIHRAAVLFDTPQALAAPRTVRPFGSVTGDLRATQQLLGHASRATTDRYTLAAVPERLQLAVGQTEKLFKGERIVAAPRGSTKPVLVTSTKHSERP